jgi:type II secretory pathway pseudopilin PulG
MIRRGADLRPPSRARAGGPVGSRRAAGLTLVETLVALAVAAILLVGFASLVANARRTAVKSVVTSDATRALDLAASLLSEEVRLAGSVPWPRPDSVEGTDDLDAFVATGLWLDTYPAADGDSATAGGERVSLRLRYVDARLAGEPVARDVTFEIGVDGRGVPQLYRRAGGAARQPLVEGVGALRLLAVVEDGLLIAPPVPGTFRPSALVLEVSLDAAWAGLAGAGAGSASVGDGGGELAASTSSIATERETRGVVVSLPNHPTTIVTTPSSVLEATP